MTTGCPPPQALLAAGVSQARVPHAMCFRASKSYDFLYVCSSLLYLPLLICFTFDTAEAQRTSLFHYKFNTGVGAASPPHLTSIAILSLDLANGFKLATLRLLTANYHHINLCPLRRQVLLLKITQHSLLSRLTCSSPLEKKDT